MLKLATHHGRSLSTGAGQFAHHQRIDHQTQLIGVDEAMDDLSELLFLLKDLAAEAEQISAVSYSRIVADLKGKQLRCVDLLERASRWGSSPELSGLLASIRKEYLSMKADLRLAFRLRGTALCAGDWQSPAYAATLPQRSNRLSQGVAEHVWDYKRDGHLEAVAYEQAFVDEYAAHLCSQNVKAYLANSGMAAWSTVLHWLAHESDFAGEPAVAIQPMYFENLHLARGFFPQLHQLRSAGKDAVLGKLQSLSPSIVFCDAVSNCGEVLAPELEAILQWAGTEAPRPLAIVIDATCLPMAMLPARTLENLPASVSVFFVESLAKHHQFGMDIVTGGIIVSRLSTPAHDSLRKARARFGMNISDASVGCLPRPNRDRLIKRMRRHSRNVNLLSKAIESRTDNNGLLHSVSWLQSGPRACPWYRGDCLTLKFHQAFSSVAIYKEFEDKVLELCAQRNYPLVLGTSFGFDVARLYVTAPGTKFEEPFLRIAPGTEYESQIPELVDIIMEASLVVRKALPAEMDSRLLPGHPAHTGADLRSDARGNVFVGEQALNNYLSPANYPATPLVELPPDLNPFAAMGVRILAKIMPLVPLMNIKSIPAYSMLSRAAERGETADVHTLIESSSSNTVLSLSVLGKLFGINETQAIVDHSISPALMRMLRLFGIEILMHPAAGHPLFGKMAARSERATSCGEQPGWLNPGQYSNADNPEGFARWLAPDLVKQTHGKLAVLSCALGTCGTMVGVSRGLRLHNPQIEIVACCPASGQAVPGPRERSLLADVTFDWQTVANQQLELDARESFTASVKLLRRGIMGGPSSGMNYAGLLRYLEQEKESGRLQQRLNAEGELCCAFLCCDSPLPHVNDYFEVLGDEFFPAVHPVPVIGE